ncbi:MAG: MGMT family protein [Thermoplasmata archaeon]
MRKEDIRTERDIISYLKDRSEFERAVYVSTFRIPRGKVSTYGRIASMSGRPGACRAVANALHNNPLYPIVPCWRVVRSDGSFGGKKKVAASRRKHVENEGVPTKGGRVIMTKDIVF